MKNESFFRTRSFRWAELLVVFVVFPCLLIFNVVELKLRWIIYILTLVYVLLGIRILSPTRSQMGLTKPCLRIVLAGAASYFLVATIACLVWFYSTRPDAASAVLVAGIVIGYPLLSAPAQELLFRSYFFHRYNGLVGQGTLAVLNVVLFAVYHLIFGSWLAVGLSLVAGSALTLLYTRFGSVIWTWLLHAFLGIVVLAAGIGNHFTDLLG